MSLTPGAQAPYTTVQALTTVIDWFRDKGPTGPVTTDAVMRAGVTESLARRTIQSLLLLDLIDKDGTPSEQFEAFRSIRGDDEYKNALQEWVRATYADVLVYSDPSSDSLDKIVESFRGYEPQGQRRGMASLFLGLWKHAGLPTAASSSQAKERTTPRAAGTKPRSATRQQRPGRSEGGDQTTSPGQSTDGLPPGLVGLLHQIPRGGAPWTRDTRDDFLTAFAAVLNFSVPISDPSLITDAEPDDEEVPTP